MGVQVLRKLLLSIAVVSIASDPSSKLVVVFLILFGSMYLQAQFRPYRTSEHNNLEFRMHGIAILVLLSSLVFANRTLNSSAGPFMRFICLFAIIGCVSLCVLETLKIGKASCEVVWSRIKGIFKTTTLRQVVFG
eukprot:TRINITY_DN4259_c0_g1_i12.p1 TRINITY_DN4259_c0_g1~~TRINITY_DN4259_c0_g1_i12.p1  ORF type:complete len:143 (-),score=42.89 TRINITY_DN4259_c0_g1_i12:239-643(-)